MNEQDMDMIAEAISLAINNTDEDKAKAAAIVKSLTDKYPLYED